MAVPSSARRPTLPRTPSRQRQVRRQRGKPETIPDLDTDEQTRRTGRGGGAARQGFDDQYGGNKRSVSAHEVSHRSISVAGQRYGDLMRAVRIGLPIAVLFVVASAAAVAVPLVRASRSASEPDERTAAAVEQFVCAQVASSIDDYCDRIAGDLGRRMPVTDDDRVAAQPRRQALLDGFVRELGADCPGPLEPCRLPATTPEAVRQALVAAGFNDPVVRPARYTDPAPAGAILYAVRVGRACLLGHVRSETAAPPLIVGRLPHDACLSP